MTAKQSQLAGFLSAIALLTSVAATAQPSTSDLDVYLTVGTDYMSRGMSLTGGEGALQAGIEYQHTTGFVAGAWLYNVDYDVEARFLENPRNEALETFIGYGRDLDIWSWTIALNRYTYPNVSVDYDYNMLSGSFSWRRRIYYTASYTNRLFGLNSSAISHEIAGELPLQRDITLSAAVAHFDSSGQASMDYSYWNVGVSKIIRRFSIDFRFYDTNTRQYSLLGEPADRQWVLSWSTGFDLRSADR